jgi:hypothetical protein
LSGEKAEKESPQRMQLSDTEDEIISESNQPLEESGGSATTQTSTDAPAGHKRRRRGRRGGRRHRGQRTGQGPAPAEAVASPSSRGAAEVSLPPTPARQTFRAVAPAEAEPEPAAINESAHHPAAAQTWQGHARAGEPALASRMAQLESQLRRLLACPLSSLEEADRAPAGPGVLLLSDSDQQTHYYIESCQTLRIGIGNLLRGGRGGKDSGRLKDSMAENLGIAESRVPKYLKDHCIVRWLQLDEGAAELAHFAIAVLRPQVNE